MRLGVRGGGGVAACRVGGDVHVLIFIFTSGVLWSLWVKKGP